VTVSASQVAQMRKDLADKMGDVVAVETFSGESAYGPIYGTSANVTCNANQTRTLVRGANGEEVLSELTLQVASTDEDKFAPETRVTFASRTSTVISVSRKTFRGLVAVVEVVCT